MYHLIAWKDTAGSAALIDMTPIQDGIVAVVNNHFIPDKDLQLVAGYVSGVHAGRARFNSATLRQINPSYIRPINFALLPISNNPIYSLIRATLQIKGQEELQVELTQTANTAEHSFALAWLRESYDAPAMGTPYTIRFSATQTAVAGVWTMVSYNLETGLPVGTYQMVSSELFSTTGIAHRWTFDNQYWRPGGLCYVSEDMVGARELYQASLGAMGSFRTFSLPRLEWLANAADAAFTGYMTVVRVGP